MIYLDNAATSYPKPECVINAVADSLRRLGGNPGRGAHPLAMAAAECVYDCREKLASLFSAPDPSNVIMQPNTTYALNLAIKGLLPPRGGKHGEVRERIHIIISDLEHNSVLRPIERMRRDGLADYSVFPSCAAAGGVHPGEICSAIERLINRRTRAVVCTAASNICSVTMPLEDIGELCRRRGLIFIVDGAQGCGHIKIDMKSQMIDALALPGHKGLQGPGGSGALLLGGKYMPIPLVEGGSGAASFDTEMPSEPPERYEAGTLSVPAIAGLGAGVSFVASEGIERIHRREQYLFDYALDRLRRIGGEIQVLAPRARGSVLSFTARTMSSDKLAAELGARGICVRGGYHCAPLAHRTLGSDERGSVRLGFGIFNDISDIDAVCEATADILKHA